MADAGEVHQLVKACPPLDLNSAYCYMLLARHHAETCVVARRDSRIVGFVSAYLIPASPRTLFVWQVAVHSSERGKGVGGRMLDELLARPECSEVCCVETTVTPSNKPSGRMFERLAERLGAPLHRATLVAAGALGHQHEEEVLLTIGPFSSLHSKESEA